MLNEEQDWDTISGTIGLSEEYIRENSDKVNWTLISVHQKLSEGFIRENSDKVNWYYISKFQKLSENFIIENSNKVDWGCISYSQKFSEEFIRENSDKVNWYNISKYQKLSEWFIRENSDSVDWVNICCYQKLSEDFIRENFDNLNCCYITIYQKLSPGFIKEYGLDIPETCWLYKDKEFKREYIKENTTYEIIGDKVIAYKTCRSDGYSKYNFQYYYEVGKEYEAHADYNIDEEDSFGLSAWTEEGSLKYCNNGKLFKIEIDLENIAAIVHDGNKIRASKIKILEEIN